MNTTALAQAPVAKSRFGKPARRPQTVAGGGVFAINFARRDILSARTRRILVIAGLSYAVVNAVLLVVFFGMAAHAHLESRRFENRLEARMPPSDAIRELKAEMTALHADAIGVNEGLEKMILEQQQRQRVGERLAALTRTLPARTWITSLTGTREDGTLRVNAQYVIDNDHPYASPVKEWISTLRTDASFRSGLSRLEMVSSTRRAQGQANLLVFELQAVWMDTQSGKDQ